MHDLVSDGYVGRAWTVILEASDAAARAVSKRLRPLGITLPQARVLLVLSNSASPPTRSEISQIVLRKPHTITALLNGMERAGLIKRIKGLENHQLVSRIVMTTKGRKLWEQVRQTQLSMELRSHLSIQEFQQLIKMMEKLRDAAVSQL